MSSSGRYRIRSWRTSASTKTCFAIGRAEAPFDSCAPEAVAQLSRRHARIFTEHGAVYLADLDSKNGTSVNGVEVRQKPAQLHHGDTICFGGKLSYRVQFVPRERSRARPWRAGSRSALTPRARRPRIAADRHAQFPFLISKADELIARYREEYPHQVNYVSRRHAHIFLKSGAPFIEDLGSTNGTFVNGERLDAPAVPLGEGTVVAFGGTHFVYRVSVRREPEGDSTLTQVKPTAAKAKADVDADSDKTTFVGSAHSFLDIFCVDQPIPHEDEVNQEALPAAAESKKEGERRRERSKFAMMFSALRAAFTGNERVTSRRGLIIGAVVIAALAAISMALFFNGSSERQVKGLIASGEFEQAASVAGDYLQRHPNDPRFSALDTEALLKAKVPEWLAALRSNQFDKAERGHRADETAWREQPGRASADRRMAVDRRARELRARPRRPRCADPYVRGRRPHRRDPEALGRRRVQPSAFARPHRFVRAGVRDAVRPGAQPSAQAGKRRLGVSRRDRAAEGEHREGTEPRQAGSAGRRA